MLNEYGETLDRNGYAPSIVQDIDGCYFCARQDGKLDRHEIFHGAYRQKSKALGLWVTLCSPTGCMLDKQSQSIPGCTSKYHAAM